MIKIIKAKEYFEDLMQIDHHISESMGEPKAALRTVLGIEEAVSRIGDYPEIGKKFTYGLFAVDLGYRFIVHDDYIVFYKLVKDEIWIERVFSTKMDYINKILNYYK